MYLLQTSDNDNHTTCNSLIPHTAWTKTAHFQLIILMKVTEIKYIGSISPRGSHFLRIKTRRRHVHSCEIFSATGQQFHYTCNSLHFISFFGYNGVKYGVNLIVKCILIRSQKTKQFVSYFDQQ